MTDLVIDTNVWMHAHNTKCKDHGDSLRFITGLPDSSVVLCIDAKPGRKQGMPIESKILGEYGTKFSGSAQVGAVVLAHLLDSKRFRHVVLKNASSKVKNWARDEIGNKKDRPFILVASLTDTKTLVSHDRDDFPDAVRTSAKRKIKVNICDAGNAQTML